MIKTSETVLLPRSAASILRTMADRIERGEIQDIHVISHQELDNNISTGAISIQVNAVDRPARTRYRMHVDGAQRLTKEAAGESA